MTVECTAAANPAPASYVWSRVAGDTWRHAGRHLRLRNVTAADSGEYRYKILQTSFDKEQLSICLLIIERRKQWLSTSLTGLIDI